MADRVNLAMECKMPQLQKRAMTVLAYKRGILSWYSQQARQGRRYQQ